jgi:hypothetical protein
VTRGVSAGGVHAAFFVEQIVEQASLPCPPCRPRVVAAAYTYDGAGRVATVTAPGLAAWHLGGDGAGRLSTVSRTHDTAYGGGTETTRVVYGISTSPDGTHPEYRLDLTGTAIVGWGVPMLLADPWRP